VTRARARCSQIVIQTTMRRQEKTTDTDAALEKAHTSFRTIASQRLKSMQARGLEGPVASSRLLDDLIERCPRPSEWSPSSGATSSSSGASRNASLEHVVACTGFGPTHASKILLLKDEISRLRSEGHSTVAVIQQLQGRLRDAGDHRARGDENGEQGVRRSATSKKRRVDEGDRYVKHSASESWKGHWDVEGEGGIDQLQQTRLQPLPAYGACAFLGEGGRPQARPSDSKRQRDEGTPLSQLKKLKLLQTE
jgi:hypothetical protein